MPGITIDTTLRAYYEKHQMELVEKLYALDPFRSIFPLISDVQDTFVTDEVEVTELIQAFQEGFTPKGLLSIKPEILRVNDMKVDFVFSPKTMEKTYRGDLKTTGSSPYDIPFERFVIDKLLKKVSEEHGFNTMNAIRVEPTKGTPGRSIDSMNGLLKILVDLITATKLVPEVTGAITDDNIIDKVKQVWLSVPEHLRMKNMNCYISEYNLFRYFEKKKALNGNHVDYVAGKTTIDFTNTKLTPLPNMGASNRIFITFPGNIVLLEDGSNEDNKFEVEKSERQVKVMFDFKRGVGVRISGNVGGTAAKQYLWLNDQI